MRVSVWTLVALVFSASWTFGFELTDEQREPWDTLEAQVALDIKKDVEGQMKYMHPKACFWGDQSPVPISGSAKTFSYYAKWLEGLDDVVAHNMIPVSVVVVDDVAIINFYVRVLTRDDEGKQKELMVRGHNTWKKEGDRWLLLATYNTKVKPGEYNDWTD
jgi:ketosteroid isomerase-like protein